MGERKQEVKTALHRFVEVSRAAIDETARTVTVAFSSETEKVERYDGVEILDHGPGSVRLGRLQNKAPLMLDHDIYDGRKQIGVVESVELGADRVARAVVRFGKSGLASEIFADLVDGIRTKVSVGYWTYARADTDEGTSKKPVYRVTDWEPYEISIVTVAADDDVGVGRHAETFENDSTEKPEMSKVEAQPVAAERAAPPAPAAPAVDVEKERTEARKAEQQRIREISAIGKRRGLETEADQFIDDGKTVDQFRAYVLDNMSETTDEAPRRHANVDLNDRENQEYSVTRALSANATGDWSKAGFEREISQELAKQLGKENSGRLMIPSNLRHTPEMMRRVIASGGQVRAGLETDTNSAGGFAVQTSILSLIDLLRNKMMVRRMGARVLAGLQGNIAFPRLASGSTFSWVAENPGSDLADSDAVFEQVTLSPKTGQSTTAFSRELLAQGSVDIEMLVRDDLTLAAAVGLDAAAINGSGTSNQPEGILNVTGIGSVAGGANGATPDWADIVDLESAVAVDNADIGTLGYLTNTAVRGVLKQTEKASGTAQFVWETMAGGMGMGEMNGYIAGCSNNVPSNLTKGTASGVCSAIIFGNWNDLLIGEWGAIEIITDPYSKKKQGMIEVTSHLMADIAVRHPESFAAMQDALTA